MTDEEVLDKTATRIFSSIREGYQSKGWSQQYLGELVGVKSAQQFNRIIRVNDNTPRAKEVRNRVRDVLGIN